MPIQPGGDGLDLRFPADEAGQVRRQPVGVELLVEGLLS
jgi:hypothetical protein